MALPLDAPPIRFGVFELDLRSRELRKNGLKVKIERQPLDLLQLLLERPGDLVTPTEIRQTLWSDGTIVEYEHSIKTAVKKLRQALGDDASNPRFVETVARRGYRFIAPAGPAWTISSPPMPASPAQAQDAVAQTSESQEKDLASALKVKNSAPQSRNWILPLVLVGVITVTLGAWIAKLSGWDLPDRLLGRSNLAHVESLAVLPLENISGDKEEEYFADGMTEQLITTLGKIDNLRVISRTSAMRYKRTTKSLEEIGRELQVDAVVEGAVLRAGNRVRITTQLIQVHKERQLWGESYEANVGNVLVLQSQIARAIADRVNIKLSPEWRSHLASAHPVNPEAYVAYLKGRYFWNKRTEEDLKKGIAYFEQAVRKDERFAPAYAGLSDANQHLVLYDMAPPRERMPVALNMARKALEIDPDLAEAHASLAAVRLYYDWQLSEAQKEYARAVELNPGYAVAHWWYGLCFLATGDYVNARRELDRAESEDPLSVSIRTDSGFLFTQARDPTRGIRKVQEALELEPESPFSLTVLGFAFRCAGHYQEAIATLEKAHTIAPNNQLTLGLLGSAYAVAGKRADALQALQELDKLASYKYVSSYSRVLVYTALRDKEQAFLWLAKAAEERSPRIAYIRTNLTFDFLRSDPRFDALRKRVGL